MSTENQNHNNDINITELFKTYVSKWYIFAITVFICLVGVVIYIKTTPNTFNIYSNILIKTDDKSNPFSKLAMGTSELFGGKKDVENEIEILKSKRLTEKMITELGIESAFYQKMGWRWLEMYKDNCFLDIIYSEQYLDSLKGCIEIEIDKYSPENIEVEVVYTHGFPEIKDVYNFKLTSMNQPIEIGIGTFKIIEKKNAKNKYEAKILNQPVRSWRESYAKRINAKTISKKCDVVTISMVHENPEKATDIINKMVELYDRDALEDKNRMSIQLSKFIDERLIIISRELSDVESEVEAYRKKHNLANINEQAKLFVESSQEYEKQKAVLETQYSLIAFMENYLKGERGDFSLIPSAGEAQVDSKEYNLIPKNVATQGSALDVALAEYNKEVLLYQKLKQSSGEKNPVTIQAEKTLELTKANIIKSIQNFKRTLEITISDVQKKGLKLSAEVNQIPTVERQYIDIARQQQIKNQLYLILLQKREETHLTLASNVTESKVVDYAHTDGMIVAPNKKMLLVIALILGVLLAMGYIYILDVVKTEIRDTKQLKKISKLPILGQIPQIKNCPKIVVKEGHNSSIAEMFRMIRANLNFVPSKVMMITSSTAGEGKSFISINIATALSMTNKKVVLVGLDVRKPTLGSYLGINQSIGVTNYLIDPTSKISDLTQKMGNLDIITSGPIPPNPTELISSERLGDFFEQLRAEYDYVIVDTAPIGIVSDSLIISQYVDSTIYVCRLNVAPKHQIEALNNLIENKKLKHVSLVVNGVSQKSVERYGYGTKKYNIV